LIIHVRILSSKEESVTVGAALDVRAARELVEGIPPYSSFRTVAELDESSRRLAEKYPNTVELRTIGESSEGREITALVIGEGDKSAFMYGFTHPNEPIGSLTIDYLASRLAASAELRKKLGYRFILAKVIDVDGARLNEGWFRGPFDLLTYAENYYRPPPNEQAEWTFPIDYKTLHWHTPNPETRAIKKIVDEFKPEFTYILHNADFCGVYYYLSHELPSAYAELKNIPSSERLPLHKGEPPDEPYLKSLDEGIYHDYGATDEYDFLSSTLGCDPATRIDYGTCCYEYILRMYGGFSLTCELPYFYDERIMDTAPARSRRRDLLLESLKIEADTRNLVNHVLEESREMLNVKSRIYRSIQYLVGSWSETEETMRKHSEDQSFDRAATVAEEFDLTVLKRFSQMPILGMMERLLKEAEAGKRSQKLGQLREEARSRLLQLNADISRESNPQVIPIQILVRIQLQSAIVCLKHLESRK
jgi:hypothetical protein